ncbi:hypothetical protein TIFTF001_041798 [Ficus carica]|uniref:Uncharacterized protein n=1 Tax=Ficus carica TaxID=3494 RepID=A0AA88CS99_FICCA|nr:hypothetical protein TIFTF001_041798 [Ficus carica]
MAEMMVLSILTEAVVSQAIERLSYLLLHEAGPLASVKHDVESFHTELKRIQSLLSSVDGRQAESGDDRVRNWVSEIRNIACDIEDVIEIFIVKMEFSYLGSTFHLRSLRKEIDSIKTRMKSIFESKVNYEIRLDMRDNAAVAGPSAVELRRSYPDDDEDDEERDDVTGLDDKREALKNRLMEEQEELCAIPIVGMGGLGKTTLAKIVFNDSDVKQHFECCTWVLISQQYVARDVFSEILMQIGFPQSPSTCLSEEILEERRRARELLKNMEEGELIGLIKNKLGGKRYLVVLDDIWRADAWNSIRRIFPKGKSGSKIVLTTRMKELVNHAAPRGCEIEPTLLTPEESWELLHRKAFPSDVFGKRVCPPEFEKMGKEMVKKCGGLPLAIVVLGGLLRTKTSEDEWNKVLKDVNAHLTRFRNGQQHGIEEMLALSYHDLPYYLKPCFLYLGSFPEDMEIPRRKLIQLWIAEGLVTEPITSPSGQTMEEIADQYLRELIDRCMVQVGSKDYTGIGVKTCRVHHLMRDFCVSKAREDNFSEVIRQHEIGNMMETTRSFSNHQLTLQTKTRRISIHAGCDLDPRRMHRCLRSLLCFDVSSPTSLAKFVKSKNLRLLRVLEFGFNSSTIHKCKVPTEIGDLIHLRYLGLRGAGKVKLPSSIGNLRNLCTINLRDNAEVVLPVEIFRLKRLKHLLLPFGTCFPPGYSMATYLLSDARQIQTLKYISFGKFLLRNKILQLEMANLRNLGVQFENKEDVRSFLQSPNFKLAMLQSLHMSILSSTSFSSLQPLSQCVFLSKLFLDGKISRGQSLEFLPRSLTKLILRDSGLRDDPMAVLERLPNLRFLGLHNAYTGTELICSAEGFQRLETLQLFSLEKVTNWELKDFSMPNLKRLHIKHMHELTMIPEGMKNISSLRELKIIDMRRSFEDRIRVKDGIEGVDFYKVSHVSSISFSWTLPSYQFY